MYSIRFAATVVPVLLLVGITTTVAGLNLTTSAPENVYVTSHQTFNITFRSSGSDFDWHTPEVKYNGTTDKPNSVKERKTTSSIMMYTSVSISGLLPDSVNISCQVDQLEKFVSLIVIPVDSHEDSDIDTSCVAGEDATLTVRLSQPLPEKLGTVWFKDGENVTGHRMVPSHSDGRNFSLKIINTEKNDNGTYYFLIYDPTYGIQKYLTVTQGIAVSLTVFERTNVTEPQVMDKGQDSSGLQTGAYVGIAIAVIVVLALVVVGSVIYIRKRRGNQTPSTRSANNTVGNAKGIPLLQPDTPAADQKKQP